jgi:predicted ribosomally synthesized peptide with SipW-like signal peptide
MNKKIIISLCVIGAVAAIAIGGTMAYFSDTATSTGNTWTAGTLVLSEVTTGSALNNSYVVTPTGGINGSVQFGVSADPVKPGSSGTITWTLNNTGNVPGTMTLASTATFDQGGTANAPEAAAETGGAKGLDTGIKVWVTAGGFDILGTTGAYVDMLGLEAALDLQVNHAITIGIPLVYVLNWQVPITVGNEIQGDTANLDITFTLNQIAI